MGRGGTRAQGSRPSARIWLTAAATLTLAALALTVRVPDARPDPAVCSSGPRTLSNPGDRVYPDQGNGGYTSIHTDLHSRCHGRMGTS